MGSNGESISIHQININGVNSKKGELSLLAEHNKNDDGHIILLNDTRLSDKKRLRLIGYKTIRKDYSNKGGGVAILFKNGMQVNEVACDINEMLIVEVKTSIITLIVSTLYLHPGEVMTQKHFDALLQVSATSRTNSIILMGDLNAHCGLDKRAKTDKVGQILNNLVHINSFAIMNDNSPTFYASNKSISSCIDLCITKDKGTTTTKKWSVGGSYGSDHRATNLKIHCGFKAEARKIAKTDWGEVRNSLVDFSPVVRCGSKSEIDECIEEFASTIKRAVDANTREKKFMTRNDVILSNETKDFIQIRRKLNKIRKSWDDEGKPTELVRKISNFANREIKRLIKRDLEKSKASKIEKIWDERDAAKSWRMLKDMEPEIGKSKAECSSIGIEDRNGVVQKDESTVAEIHADRLEEAHSFPTDPLFLEAHRQKIDNEVDLLTRDLTSFNRITEEIKNSPNADYWEAERIGTSGKKLPPKIHDDRITANEIYHHLKKKKNKSAGGEDGVTYKMLKHAGKNAICALAKIYTVLLVAGYFPVNWRSVRISMIPKSGKDLKHSKNWRPISLSSCLSKVFESCIKERFEKEKEKRKIKESIFQSAYKKNRGCQEQIVRLCDNVTHGFAKQESTLAVFLDVAGAFDKVYINGLLWKLAKMKLPKHLVGTIKGFLTERELRVRVGKKFSRKIKMKSGTPQGAVLSPTLFNLFVDDLREAIGIDDDVQLGQYADDICIWSTCDCPRKAEEKINKALQKIADWTAKWRIKLAPEKSVCVLFSRRPTHRRMTMNLNLMGEKIKRVESHRFLGVKFDEKLDWKIHVEGMIGRSTPRINALKKMSAKSLWRRPEWFVKLHESVVSSIWRYGSVAYAAMGEHLWGKLISCHARAIKAYCGVPSFVGYGAVCDQIGVKQIKEDLMAFAKKRLLSIIAFSPLGKKLIDERRQNVTGIYKSPTEVLINDNEALNLVS